MAILGDWVPALELAAGKGDRAEVQSIDLVT